MTEWSTELKSSSILVVDDTPDNLRYVASILSEQGCKTVRLAPSGKHALASVEREIPDLILLDVTMPDIDGYEVCRRLKSNERTKDISIIFLTGLDGEEAELKGFDYGAVDFVTKPIKPQRLLARARTHLELAVVKKKLQAQNKDLLEAARLREDVERMTKHDLKNPLNIVIGYSTLLEEELDLSGEHKEFLQSIIDAAYKILKMIENSLDLYKMETNAYALKPATFDVVPSINRILQSVAKKFSKKSLQYAFSINGHHSENKIPFAMWGEELLIHSMLGNLIANAAEAAPDNSTVSVSLQNLEDKIEIKIHNMGCVPKQIRDKFFEKYVTAGKAKGTGIGTYSASLIAKNHGGEIMMKSSEDSGTSITIGLPTGATI